MADEQIRSSSAGSSYIRRDLGRCNEEIRVLCVRAGSTGKKGPPDEDLAYLDIVIRCYLHLGVTTWCQHLEGCNHRVVDSATGVSRCPQPRQEARAVGFRVPRTALQLKFGCVLG